MLKTIALIGLGTTLAFTPLPAIAQTDQSAAPAASAPAATAPTGSHKSQMRHRANMSKERARASATGLPGLRGVHVRLDLVNGANGRGFRNGDTGAKDADG